MTPLIIMLLIPGAFFFIMNWLIFINNHTKGKKWVSGTPPLGGALIAAAFLLSPVKPLALIGLADPGLWLMVEFVFVCIKEIKNKK